MHRGTHRRSHRRSLLAALTLVAGAALSSATGLAQEVRLRYAHVGAEGDIQYWFADEAAKKHPARRPRDASPCRSSRTRSSAASRR